MMPRISEKIQKYKLFSNQQDNSFLFFLLLLIFVVLHFKTATSLGVFWWNSFTYGYGLLVAPISIYFMWKKWPCLFGQQTNISVIGILLLVFANIIWFVAFLVDVQSIALFSLIAILAALILACTGKPGLILMRFPLLYLVLATPIWDPLELMLQNITTIVVGYWLNIVDIPSYVKGVYIEIPEGEFQIETTCAGLRYFLASLAIFYLYTHLYIKKHKMAIALLAVALLMAIMLNWVRVFIVIVAGHLTNMQHFLVNDHANFGWWLFAIAIIPVFMFGNYLQKREMQKSI